MNQRQNDIPAGCAEWKDEIQALLDLPSNDPMRQAWESHAAECPACNAALADENRFHEMFDRLPDPGPAYVTGRVMRIVRSEKRRTGPFHKWDILYGIAGSVAGVIIGFWLTGLVSNGATHVEPAAVYAAAIAEMPTGLDDLVDVFTETTEEDN